MNILMASISVDIIVFALSIAFSDNFVMYSYNILSKIYEPIRLDVAYGCVLLLFSFASSVTRSLRHGNEVKRNITAMGLVIRAAPILAAIVVASSISNYPATMVTSDVTSPYVSYIFSVIFCLGFGYSLSDTIFYFFRGIKK